MWDLVREVVGTLLFAAAVVAGGMLALGSWASGWAQYKKGEFEKAQYQVTEAILWVAVLILLTSPWR